MKKWLDRYESGGLVSKNSLNRTVKCSNCGWSWKLSDGGEDPLTCHKCGGTIKMKNGGEQLDQYQSKGQVNFKDQLLQRNAPIVDRGNFSNVPYRKSDQIAMERQNATNKRIAQQELQQELSARKAKEKGTAFTLPTGATKKYKDMNVKERSYVDAQVLKNKGRWNENQVEQPFLNNFNPITMLYNMGAGLGEAPLMSNVTNSYMPYVTGVAAPLAAGALAGIGANTTGQFINNLANPLAGTGELIDNLGNKYLPNASKINPWRFKEKPDAYYRQVFSPDKIENPLVTRSMVENNDPKGIDAFIRASEEKFIDPRTNTPFELLRLPTRESLPFFNKGKVYFNKNYTKNIKEPELLIESKVPFADYEDFYPAATNYVSVNPHQVNEALQMSKDVRVLSPFSEAGHNLENYNFYKPHWLKRYKKIKFPNIKNSYLENNRFNLVRNTAKIKRDLPSKEEVDLGNGLILENNPSRVKDKESILGTKRTLVSVKNTKTNEYIELRSWLDPLDNKIKYYFSADMPSSKIKAGKAYAELEKHIPIGAEIKEPFSLSFDSFTNTIKQTKNPKFKTSIQGEITLNDSAVFNKLKNKGDSFLGDVFYKSAEKAQLGAEEINALLKKYNLPKAEVRLRENFNQQKSPVYEIRLPNISLKKLYTVLGISTLGTLNQKQEGGIIEDDMGQWAHPGQVTRINSNQITMEGVPYPVLGVDNTGYVQMMQPQMNYTFPGQYVTEYPMAQNGLQIPITNNLFNRAFRNRQLMKQEILDENPALQQVMTLDNMNINYARRNQRKLLEKLHHNPEYFDKDNNQNGVLDNQNDTDEGYPYSGNIYTSKGIVKNPNPGEFTTLINKRGMNRQQIKDAATNDFISHSLHYSPQYQNYSNKLHQMLLTKYPTEMIEENGGVDAYIRSIFTEDPSYSPYKKEMSFIDPSFISEIKSYVKGIPKKQKGGQKTDWEIIE
jgi:hypothetical protein